MVSGALYDFAKPAVPNQDKRWRLVDATMRRMGQQSRGLIETLHTVQEAFGYLDEQALRYVATSLRVPLSRAYGVATFYHFFTLKPAGEHTCVICMGTACYIKGAPQLLDAVKRDLGVVPGETTADGKVSVLTARCLGSCGLRQRWFTTTKLPEKLRLKACASTGELEDLMTPEELSRSQNPSMKRKAVLPMRQRLRRRRLPVVPEPSGQRCARQGNCPPRVEGLPGQRCGLHGAVRRGPVGLN